MANLGERLERLNRVLGEYAGAVETEILTGARKDTDEYIGKLRWRGDFVEDWDEPPVRDTIEYVAKVQREMWEALPECRQVMKELIGDANWEKLRALAKRGKWVRVRNGSAFLSHLEVDMHAHDHPTSFVKMPLSLDFDEWDSEKMSYAEEAATVRIPCVWFDRVQCFLYRIECSVDWRVFYDEDEANWGKDRWIERSEYTEVFPICFASRLEKEGLKVN